ncbi:flavin-containing monooxygenase [Aspergillus fischeri NRRL 181]|uniref:Monooxygenase n=1 Tax=Neosartorya fischeri (strain ATCC 1020 / DSM 3700 / CBS 544.65 / FGSC A1164 / JCM 1740 / NRRL 181 / WB 181) TaxID=331117 RepID=A1D0T3_NEOFI|nr:monooxygenase [Aspergillus fischeri NRRL 181]EAW24603.1 monooxygenase [Aspergillus fischeri NRRL 181]KAG2002700.1 hypothetical protein GB937_009570 [Aspergillus fischeri]
MPAKMLTQPDFDAIVIGAGFGGIYMCKKLVAQGLSVKVIEAAPDVGGTWYWNRYPGALSDTRSFLYRYSWDLEDLRQYPWKREYLTQREILAYLNHVVERHDLRQYMQFNTEMQGASYDTDQNLWTVSLSSGQQLRARYLITAVGLLSKINYPDIPGLNSFKGEMHHTGNWPSSYDFTGKRVGVIGNGSTGVQLITALADQDVKQLLSFQRHPQYVVPAGDAEVPPATREDLDKRWEQVWREVKDSTFGFGFKESSKPTFSVSEEERDRIFGEAWAKGGGFYFMFGTFCDISYNEEANNAAAEFIRRKIRQKVKDPVKAEKLMPYDWYARRPLCATGYYEKFNRPNVDVVDIKTNPITKITDKGIQTAEGSEYELDVLIFATGFDAVDGNYKRMCIQGASQDTLKDRWKEEPSSFLGVSIPGFPNLFSILGPNSPFTNLPPLIEVQVEFISDMISHARKVAAAEPATNGPRVEADAAALRDWIQKCDELSADSLFRKTNSWIFGANVAGKKPSVLFYFGGLAMYRQALQKIVQQGYKGFSIV